MGDHGEGGHGEEHGGVMSRNMVADMKKRKSSGPGN